MKVPKFDADGDFEKFDNVTKKKLKPELVVLLESIDFLYKKSLEWKGNQHPDEMESWVDFCKDSRKVIYEALLEVIESGRLD